MKQLLQILIKKKETTDLKEELAVVLLQQKKNKYTRKNNKKKKVDKNPHERSKEYLKSIRCISIRRKRNTKKKEITKLTIVTNNKQQDPHTRCCYPGNC